MKLTTWSRLWNRENQPERYFFILRKSDGSSLNLRIKAKGNTSRMTSVPENAMMSNKTFTVMNTGKKIKFDE